MLKHLNANRRFIGRTLKRYKKTGQVQPKKKGGAFQTKRRSVRKMTKEHDVSRISLRTIVKNDLKLKLNKKQVHGITEAQKENPCMARW
jgi:DNA-binding transcriptional regulator YhcF (GntR family)